jgi:cysteine-rich repeat protein
MHHGSIRLGLTVIAAAAFLASTAPAQVDLTGTWDVQAGSSATFQFTQSGTTLTALQGIYTWEGTINPATGVFSLHTTDQTIAATFACAVIDATATPDGNTFTGTLSSASLQCSGPPHATVCQCGTFTSQPATGARVAVCGDGTVTGSEECDAGNTVGGDSCSATCTFESAGAPCADDGEACTVDVCDGAGGCHGPHAGCRTASAGAKILLRDDGSAGGQVRFGWKDASGLTTLGDFGVPTGTTAYHLCVFAGETLLFAGDVPPGSGWQMQTKGFAYKSIGSTPDGIGTVKLRSSGLKTKLFAKGKGAPVDFTGSLAVPAVRAQLLRDEGAVCWEQLFDAPKISRADRFVAKE